MQIIVFIYPWCFRAYLILKKQIDEKRESARQMRGERDVSYLFANVESKHFCNFHLDKITIGLLKILKGSIHKIIP